MFEKDETYLPVTMQQFEDLTNEILLELNKLTAPNALGPDYAASIIMEAIRALDRTKALISKKALFDSSVNLISRHVTFFAIEQIKERQKAQQEAVNAPTPETAPTLAAVPDLASES